jgi:hypothetical protein
VRSRPAAPPPFKASAGPPASNRSGFLLGGALTGLAVGLRGAN